MSYKIKEPWAEWQIVGKLNRDQKCDDCGVPPKKMRAILITPTSIFRGDDEVAVFCISCAVNRRLKLCGPVCQLIVETMTDEERLAITERLK